MGMSDDERIASGFKGNIVNIVTKSSEQQLAKPNSGTTFQCDEIVKVKNLYGGKACVLDGVGEEFDRVVLRVKDASAYTKNERIALMGLPLTAYSKNERIGLARDPVVFEFPGVVKELLEDPKPGVLRALAENSDADSELLGELTGEVLRARELDNTSEYLRGGIYVTQAIAKAKNTPERALDVIAVIDVNQPANTRPIVFNANTSDRALEFLLANSPDDMTRHFALRRLLGDRYEPSYSKYGKIEYPLEYIRDNYKREKAHSKRTPPGILELMARGDTDEPMLEGIARAGNRAEAASKIANDRLKYLKIHDPEWFPDVVREIKGDEK